MAFVMVIIIMTSITQPDPGSSRLELMMWFEDINSLKVENAKAQISSPKQPLLTWPWWGNLKFHTRLRSFLQPYEGNWSGHSSLSTQLNLNEDARSYHKDSTHTVTVLFQSGQRVINSSERLNLEPNAKNHGWRVNRFGESDIEFLFQWNKPRVYQIIITSSFQGQL